MSAFLYGVGLQWKTDFRNSNALVVFYAVPLLFFAVFGGVFTSVLPDGKQHLVAMMVVFAVSMGALIGVPVEICQAYQTNVRSTYKVNGVPGWHAAAQIEIAAFMHLLVLSAAVSAGSVLFFDASPPVNFAAFFAGVLLLICSTLSIAGILGFAVRNQTSVSAVSIAVFLPSILLSGIMFPAEMLPEALRQLGVIFPATWAFRLIGAPEVSWADVWPLLLILALGTAGTFIVMRFRQKQA